MVMGRGASRTGPTNSQRPTLSSVKEVAAGLPAVVSAWKHGIAKMGPLESAKTLSRANQHSGFDCPGCAWPDPAEPSPFEYCENGAKAIADEATDKVIQDSFWKENSVLSLARKSDIWLNAQGRLSRPLIMERDSNHYKPIDWDRAFGIIGAALFNLENEDDAYFYTSGRASNEAAFLWQLLARQHGTNNLPDCSNMCHESSGVALGESIGIGKGTVRLEDFDHSDLIVVVGQNPGTNHPRMLSALSSAKRSGSSVLSINPIKETGMRGFRHPQNPIDMLGSGVKIADDHVDIRINGDMALFRAIGSVMVENGWVDKSFIDSSTSGYDSYAKATKKINWEEIEKATGQSETRIRDIAKIFSKSRSTIICWAMGITQHRNSVDTIREIVNVLLLGGHIGRPGAGVCPVRGHSNVQGDRTVGITHAPSAKFLAAIEKTYGIRPVEGHGADAVHTVERMRERGGVFLSLGGNFLSAMSDTERTAEALEACSLTVQISTKLNRSHLITGETSIILPCLGRTDEQVTSNGQQILSVENSMGVVHMSKGNKKRPSMSMRSEPTIIAGIAHKRQDMAGGAIKWLDLGSDFSLIREGIEATVPGFEAYNSRILRPSGFELPNPPRDNKTFRTPSGRAEFSSAGISSFTPDDGAYTMMTIRSHDQFNTTIYTDNDRYRGISGSRRIVLMSREDIQERGFRTGQTVVISTTGVSRRMESGEWSIVPYEIPKGCVATYFPESNHLIPIESYAEGSFTPTSKSVSVIINGQPPFLEP
ncbi:MAG: hypothetical protein CBD52_003005 [Euryarchaeota archaeon TMED192]|nr:MAG: hypothetical protein CBD52_003005 [Euryarchaeota archaeon TMED192]